MTDTGSGIELVAGGLTAVIDPVGAALARLTWHGRDLLVPRSGSGPAPPYAGALLVPWPNRIVDGRYRFAGRPHQLELTEPERHHALHGLATDARFDVAHCDGSEIRLVADLPAAPGYPWPLRVEAAFALGSVGFTQSVRTTNAGDGVAPYGCGFHPYLVAGTGPLDDWHLELPAATVQLTTGPRLLPGQCEAVEHDPARFDFRRSRRLGDMRLDHAFTDLAADADRRVRARLTDATGAGVELTWDAALRWVQVCTADTREPGSHRSGLAIEPMTCPPDAFGSGRDVIELGPGEGVTHAWTARPLPPAA